MKLKEKKDSAQHYDKVITIARLLTLCVARDIFCVRNFKLASAHACVVARMHFDSEI